MAHLPKLACAARAIASVGKAYAQDCNCDADTKRYF